MPEIRGCPICNSTPNIEVHLPIFGFSGVVISCKNCGCQLRATDCCERISAPGKMATPVTAESLGKCIANAINRWNHRSKEANRDKDYPEIETNAAAWIEKHWNIPEEHHDQIQTQS